MPATKNRAKLIIGVKKEKITLYDFLLYLVTIYFNSIIKSITFQLDTIKNAFCHGKKLHQIPFHARACVGFSHITYYLQKKSSAEGERVKM
jgi:hypothetical protein